MAKTRTLQKKNFMDIFSGKQILIPIVALVLLAVFNLIADPSFYKITLDVNSAGNHVRQQKRTTLQPVAFIRV